MYLPVYQICVKLKARFFRCVCSKMCFFESKNLTIFCRKNFEISTMPMHFHFLLPLSIGGGYFPPHCTRVDFTSLLMTPLVIAREEAWEGRYSPQIEGAHTNVWDEA